YKTGRQPMYLSRADTELKHDVVQGNVDNGSTEHRRHGSENHRQNRQPTPAVTISGLKALYGIVRQNLLLLFSVFHNFMENLKGTLDVLVGHAFQPFFA